MSSRIVILSVLLLCAVPASAVSARFEPAVKARIDGGNVVVLFADGTRSIVPLASLGAGDRAWLPELSVHSPLAKGKSENPKPKPSKKSFSLLRWSGRRERPTSIR